MSSKVLLAVIGIVVLGAGAWFVMNGGLENAGSENGERLMEGATANDPNSLEQKDGHAAGETETGNWNDLLTMKGAAKCTVGSVTNGVESVGTVYVSNGNMRGDFSSTVAGVKVDSHIIASANTTYSWSSAMPQGIKAPRDVATGQSSGKSTQALDPNTEINFSCEAWTADATKFDPPKNVTFMDVSAMMQGSVQ